MGTGVRRAALALSLWLLSGGARAQSDGGVQTPSEPSAADGGTAGEARADTAEGELPSFRAVAIAPTPGANVEISKIPRNVVSIDRSALDRDHPLGLHDALEQRLGSVMLNDVQSNPLQPDLQYRGFTASPLLGTPQGLAIYQNGVRMNDAFGDVVQWDLLPEFAVSELQVIPGSNPLYGLNALGGSLALQMKDGLHFSGERVSALGGSFGRYQASGEVGRKLSDNWGVYLGADAFGEQGFRQESASRANHVYADLRNAQPGQELGVSMTLADTSLNGNGPAPVELLRTEGPSALYTYPDNTSNRFFMLSGDAKRQLADRLQLSGMAFLKHLRRSTSNGDAAPLANCASAGAGMPSVVCDDAGVPLHSEQGLEIPAIKPYNGLFNTTETLGDTVGGSLQLTNDRPLANQPNQLLVGASADASQVAFSQRSELSMLAADRAVIGEQVFLGDDAFRTKLEAYGRQLGVYASDTWTLVPALALTASARFNWSQIELQDRVGEALNGKHTYARVNPALGLTYNPWDALGWFLSYGESNRAPSASELACADPLAPCRVPNAFISDPPLRQVVSRSVELGMRGKLGDRPRRARLRWSLAGFGSRNADDILFVAGSHVGTGFFRNAHSTQRVGLEADVSGRAGPLRFYAAYSLVHATFESHQKLPGGANPTAQDPGTDNATLLVKPGDRIPGIPSHSFKAGVFVSPTARWELGLSAIAHGSQPYRGDEANGLGDLPGYALLNAQTSYALFDSLDLFIKVQNLLNAKYRTFGVVADPSEVLPYAHDPRFVGPGAPLAVFAGVVVHEP